MSNGFITTQLSGWGRFPVQETSLYRPEKRASVASIVSSGAQRTYIARGLGRSYGDAALNLPGAAISTLRLDCYLDFDPERAVLECEAGVSFAQILTDFLPRGFFLPVTPGTQFVTVGGAIASDVHGKNHHRDGTIGQFIESLTLLTPSGDIVVCSPAANTELYWATVGGMGLTGVILTARIRLMRVESAFVTVDYRKAQNLDAALAALAETDNDYQYSVAWIDCLARGKSLGRSVLMLGNHTSKAELIRKTQSPFARPHRNVSVPIDAPSMLLNRLTVGAFNGVYYHSHGDKRGQIVGIDSFFYPLDAVGHWNRLYGKRGFVQYQFVIPDASGMLPLVTLLEKIAASGRSSFLAVLKRFGDANPGVLSFPTAGYTLALDLPANNGIESFLRDLDRVVADAGGRVYLTKDATLDAATFDAMYPNARRFKAFKAAIDPNTTFASSLSNRIGLTA